MIDTPTSRATRDGFGAAILECARANPQLMVLSADLSSSLRLDQLKQELPSQYLEVGVSEQNMIGVAAGLALTGHSVWATSFACFNPGRNWEQIRQSVCEQNLDVKIVGSHAGLATGADGGTHQALEDIALATVLPGMKVVVPADYYQAVEATKLLAINPGPAYLRLSREPTVDLPSPSPSWSWEQWQLLRSGQQVTIIAYGLTVELALDAAEVLAQEQQLSVAVVNAATLKPLDEALLLKQAELTGAIVTVEEHQLIGGLGSMVASCLAQNRPTPIEMIGITDRFGASGSKAELFAHYGLTITAIKERVKRVLERK